MKSVTSGFTAVTTTKTPSTHNVHTTKSVLPGPRYTPAQTTVKHSLTPHEKLSEQIELPQNFKKPNQQLSQAGAFLALGLDTQQVLTGHTASVLYTQVGTVPRCSLSNRPQRKICHNHLLQEASSKLSCLSHANFSDRRQATGCRKLPENRNPLLRTSAFKKKLKLQPQK